MNDQAMPTQAVGDQSGALVAVPSVSSEVIERLRVLIVAGVVVGVVVVGAGSRLAMFVLRLTSPDHVRGVTSDDGFIIGKFTLGGTYSLLMLGAFVGIIGAAAYRAVAPWLLGPMWFRRLTVAIAAGVVVGSMLIHEDGVDFTLLKPTWLAIGLFIALPAAFGLAIGVAVDRVAAVDPASGGRHRRWILPIGLVAAFIGSAFAVAIAAVVLLIWVPLRRAIMESGGVPRPIGGVVRAGWLAIVVAGSLALVSDVRALT